MVHLFALFSFFAISVEITRELDLCFDLTKTIHEHGISQLDAYGVLATPVGIVFVLVVGPDDATVQLF